MIGGMGGLLLGGVMTVLGLFIALWQSTSFNLYGMIAGYAVAFAGVVVFVLKFVELWQ